MWLNFINILLNYKYRLHLYTLKKCFNILCNKKKYLYNIPNWKNNWKPLIYHPRDPYNVCLCDVWLISSSIYSILSLNFSSAQIWDCVSFIKYPYVHTIQCKIRAKEIKFKQTFQYVSNRINSIVRTHVNIVVKFRDSIHL